LALIHGILTPFKGQVSAPVGRLPWNREQFGIVAGGKDAVTRYEVIRHLKINFGRKTVPVTYLRLYPESGRTHQIRVHLKYLGFPILGDYLYAGRKTGREDRLWVKRTMLHASELSFIHPVTLQPLTFKTDLPPDMQRILAGAVNA
jgi:23S rRNA pseudouridine1911/1915/1917 synthase